MRTVNMAHGSLYMIGAYVGFAVFDPLYMPRATYAYAWYIAILAGIAAAAVVGARHAGGAFSAGCRGRNCARRW
jgi:branched-chain amino acid transport system permease protein